MALLKKKCFFRADKSILMQKAGYSDRLSVEVEAWEVELVGRLSKCPLGFYKKNQLCPYFV